jgi:hypothetical protein
MSISYFLEIATVVSTVEIIGNITTHFGFDILENKKSLTNYLGLSVTAIELDEESKNNARIEIQIDPDIRIYFTFKNHDLNYCKCESLMWDIVIYLMKYINGDMCLTFQGEHIIIEKKSGILSLNITTPEMYPRLIELLDIPYTVKSLKMTDLPEEDN